MKFKDLKTKTEKIERYDEFKSKIDEFFIDADKLREKAKTENVDYQLIKLVEDFIIILEESNSLNILNTVYDVDGVKSALNEFKKKKEKK